MPRKSLLSMASVCSSPLPKFDGVQGTLCFLLLLQSRRWLSGCSWSMRPGCFGQVQPLQPPPSFLLLNKRTVLGLVAFIRVVQGASSESDQHWLTAVVKSCQPTCHGEGSNLWKFAVTRGTIWKQLHMKKLPYGEGYFSSLINHLIY